MQSAIHLEHMENIFLSRLGNCGRNVAGAPRRVVCLQCGTLSDREAMQRTLERLNPGATEAVRRMVELEARGEESAGLKQVRTA